ncbi:aldo/keto reductase [Trueperella sp. LYQ143]|uniref:aldo/keto reductase n=1 Tax=unclassified Trueperella TaxID=2630174 RepID=UPI0039839C96
MKHIFLGHSGLQIGHIGMGTLTWGRDTESSDAHRMVANLLDHGGNAIDISAVYGDGLALTVLGSVLDGAVDRSELCIIGHVGTFFRTDSGAVRCNTGRGALMASVEQMLEQLNTSYLDVVSVAGIDHHTRFEETIESLIAIVSAGKARYISLSNFPAWQVARYAQYFTDHHAPILAGIGTEFSVLDRHADRDLTDVCEEFGLGICAYSPLAGGVLTGKYRHTIPPTSRAATEHLRSSVERHLEDKPRRTVEAIAKAADGLGRTPADIALAWLLSRPQVACAFVGARTHAQFDQILELDICELPEPVHRAISDIS